MFHKILDLTDETLGILVKLDLSKNLFDEVLNFYKKARKFLLKF